MLRKVGLIIVSICIYLFLSVSVFAEFSNLKPSQPAEFNAMLKSDGTVVLSWQKALYAEGYILEKSHDGITYETVVKNIGRTEFVDATKTGHRYYRITPYNKNGKGIQSKITTGAEWRKTIALESGREFIDAVGVDNYLYALGVGDNILTVFKIEDNKISLISEVINDRKFTPQSLYASDDYLYIASKIPRGGYNVMVYSVKDREKPVFKKAVSTAQIKGFCREGDYLFGAAGSSGVAVLNIKEPDKISLNTYISVEGSANACYVDNNILYVTTAAGKIKSYNITNVKAAMAYKDLDYALETYLWQQTYADNWTGESGGYIRTYSHAVDFKELIARDGIVYAASAFGIKVADFKSYKTPKYVTPIDDTLRTTRLCLKLVTDGNLLYSIGTKDIRIYNIENPKEAVQVDIYTPTQQSEIADVYLFKNKIAVVNKNGLITIYNK